MKLQRREKYGKNLSNILCIALLYLFAGTMISIYSTFVPYRDALRAILTLMGAVAFVRIASKSRFDKKNVLLPMLLFAFCSVAVTACYYFQNVSKEYAFLQCTDCVMWISIFVLSYWIGLYGENSIYHAKLFPYCVILFAYLFLGVKAFSSGQGIPLISTAYYALFLLPFVILMKNKTVKSILVLLIFATVLLSVKRGGFIAFVLSGAVYFIVSIRISNKVNPKRSYRMVAAAFIAVIALYWFFNYFVSTHSIGILDRLTSIGDDGGSKRVEVWAFTWDMIKQNNLLQLIVGRGFNTVYLNSPLELSAHTDVLEVIYDYGIVGVVLYGTVMKRIFGYYRIIEKEKPDLAPAYAVSLALWICMSAISHLVIYTTYFLYLCVFWGLIIGELDRERKVIIYGGKQR